MVRTSLLTVWSPRIVATFAVIIFTYPASIAKAQNDGDVTKPTSTAASHPLDPALAIARESLQQSQTEVRDYTALLTKRCRVDGKLAEYQQASIKIRNRRVEQDRITTPMSVYMKFMKPDTINGREVIWVENANEGQIVVHEAGYKNLLTVRLDPNGPIAMRGQRYPISEVGIEKLAEQLIQKGNRDRQYGECQVDFYQGAKVDKRSCRMVQITHPVKRQHFDFHLVQIFFDEELNLPIRYASWSWPAESGGQPVLEEEYTYTEVKINVGLTDLDFDPNNPEYDYW